MLHFATLLHKAPESLGASKKMTTRLLILTLFLIGLLSASCNQSGQDSYPKDPTVSNKNGLPKDSLTFYFPTVFKYNGKTTKTNIDTFVLNWYSSALYAFKEPILYNYYQGHDIYRFLWLRSFHRPVVFILSKNGDTVSLTTKELDRQPNFFAMKYSTPGKPDSLVIADRKANIVVNETKKLSAIEWKKFESLLTQCNFWSMNTTEKVNGNDGSEWIIEAHLQDKYAFVDRWSPSDRHQDNYANCGKYLIDLSGQKYEIY